MAPSMTLPSPAEGGSRLPRGAATSAKRDRHSFGKRWELQRWSCRRLGKESRSPSERDRLFFDEDSISFTWRSDLIRQEIPTHLQRDVILPREDPISLRC